MSGRNIKLGLATGVAGISLLAGGLLFGSTLVSAQEPTPQATEPAAPTTPAPQDQTPSDKHDCPNMNNDQSSGTSDGAGDTTTGIRFRGHTRGFAQ